MTVADDMAAARARTLAESRILREQLDPPPPPVPGPLAYTFTITCPQCGGHVEHVTTSAPPRLVGVEARAVVACAPCRDEFVITIQLASEARARRARFSLDFDPNQSLRKQSERIAS